MIKGYIISKKKLVKSFIWRITQLGFKQGTVFLIFIISAKLLNKYEFGLYNYILAIILFLTLFCDFGISTAVSKYVAEYEVTNKRQQKYVLSNSLVLVIALATLTSIISLAITPITKVQVSIMLSAIPLLYVIPISSVYDGTYRGLRRFKELAIVTIIASIITMVISIWLILNFKLIGAIISQCFFYSLISLFLFLKDSGVRFKFNREVLSNILNYSFTYGLALLGYYLFSRVGVIILGRFGYLEELATYELINKVFLLLLLPFTILGQVIAPDFTQMYARKEYKHVYEKFKKYTLGSIIAGIILSSLLYLVIPNLIQVFFPAYYNELLFRLLPWVSIMFMLNVWATTVDSGIIIPTGFAYIMTYTYLILGLLYALLSILLIDNVGYMGIIYLTSFATLLMVVIVRSIFWFKIYAISNN